MEKEKFLEVRLYTDSGVKQELGQLIRRLSGEREDWGWGVELLDRVM